MSKLWADGTRRVLAAICERLQAGEAVAHVEQEYGLVAGSLDPLIAYGKAQRAAGIRAVAAGIRAVRS